MFLLVTSCWCFKISDYDTDKLWKTVINYINFKWRHDMVHSKLNKFMYYTYN